MAVFQRTKFGYGRPAQALTLSPRSSELKVRVILSLKQAQHNWVQSEYAATLLYIPSLLFAKLAVLTLLKNISPLRWVRKAAYSVAAIFFIWAISGEFAAAFICHLPNVWDWPNGQCSDRVGSTAYSTLLSY